MRRKHKVRTWEDGSITSVPGDYDMELFTAMG